MALEKDFVLKALQKGSLALEGRFVYGSNATLLAEVQHEGRIFSAVYKPMEGERPLWDFPEHTLARREVAAFLTSEALGWDLVPPTIFRQEETPFGPGSLQVFIAHDPDYHYFNFSEADHRRMPPVIAFDLLINNADRKAGHILIDPENALWLIDHGLCFHTEDKLRTVVWDYAGQSIPAELLADMQTLLPELTPGKDLHRTLSPHLLPEEINALARRGRDLITRGVFPPPPEDRRAFPWPPV
jgi:uncharacterized repeat protein (TIGR03843 family)